VHVELRGIESVRPYEQNPRLNDQAVEAVAKSLREFGFRQPIVVDTDGVSERYHEATTRRLATSC
jgi:ParB-like chromosome segregation protein Spo0J